MKLVNYRLKYPFSSDRIGIIQEDVIIDLQAAHQELIQKKHLPQTEHILSENPHAFYQQAEKHISIAEEINQLLAKHQVEHSFSRDEVVINTPVPNPSKIICIGTNYADHVAEMGSELPEYPVLFSKFNNALIGPEDAIHKSDATEKLDYEVELAVVIGKQTSKVSKEEAFDYIAGYTIGNDTSARDLQKRTPQWLQGKSLDHTTPIGPWLVTKEELKDPGNLTIKSYVNGEQRQSSNTKQLIFDIPHLIEFISNLITLEPGDIILTGTPDGVGLAMEPPQLLHVGDTVKLEIEQIGVLENKVEKG